MKELTIEQKAKAYDEAMERVKAIYYQGSYKPDIAATIAETLQNIFPELKENEDESIRKELVAFVKLRLAGFPDDNTKLLKSLLNDLYKLEEQCEQKPTDKLEPKFKVGDWIIRNEEGFKYNTYFIKEVKDYYVCEDLKGRRVTFTFNDVHRNFKLWDISDAKDGDVLCTYECYEPKIVFILKGTPKKHCALSYYCYYNIMYPHFEDNSKKGCLAPNDEDIKPATKEQCELLFQKMKESGYEWDAETKEWKKIDNEIEIPFGAKDSELQEATYYIPKGFYAKIDDDKVVIKKGEKPTAWSEEDEHRVKDTIYFLDAAKKHYASVIELDACIDWLKSLKQRIEE